MRIDQAYTGSVDGLVLAVSLELAAAKRKVALHHGRRQKPVVLALWRYLKDGVIPQGAELKST